MITYGKLFENAKKKIDLNNLEHRAIYLFLGDILNCDKAKLLTIKDELVDDSILEKFSEMLADYIIDNKPIEYILGYTYFYNNKIIVNENVLIPRDETEELVQKSLEYIKDGDKVLDLCTGSGAIAVALKKEREKAEVYASDISERALEVARLNAKNNGVDVTFACGDLLSPFIGKEKFDVIVCNPPYISKNYVVNDIVSHEPSIALYASEDGLSNYIKVIRALKNVLNDGGTVLFEIGYDQREKVLNICNQFLSDCSVECLKDISGNDRIVIIRL